MMRRATAILSKTARIRAVQSRFVHSDNPESSDPPSDPSGANKPWTKFIDAYDPLFAELASTKGAAASSSNPSDAPSSRRPPFQQPPSARLAPLRKQKAYLSGSEQRTFVELIREMLPATTSGAGIFPAYGEERSGIDRVKESLSKSTGGKAGMQVRGNRTALSPEEEEELDRKREEMLGFATDYQLFQWALTDVFGFENGNPAAATSTLFPDPRTAPSLPTYLPQTTDILKIGPSSRIYPDLLLLLFLLLRDTHRSPTAALHIFTLASLTPYSYVLGCTTNLYNEVLRTRWMEGDVESVAESLEEMRSSGLEINDGTKSIITAIGEAIRIDEVRAEARAAEKLGRDTSVLTEEEIMRSRVFNPQQIRAWARMEWIVQENQDEGERKKVEKDLEMSRGWDMRVERREREEREEQERKNPNLANTDGEQKNEELDLAGRPVDLEPEDYDIFSSPRPSRTLHSRAEESRAHDSHRPVTTRYGEPKSGTGRSWDPDSESDEFPRRLASEFDRPPRRSTFKYSSAPEEVQDSSRPPRPSQTHFSSSLAESRAPPPTSTSASPIDNSFNMFDDTPSRAPIPSPSPRFQPSRFSNRPEPYNDNEEYDEPNEARYRESTYASTREHEYRDDERSEEGFDNAPPQPQRSSRYVATLDVDGNIVLPRRPSSMNPFKIRRKGLTKAEKSSKDTPHPMMAWKKK